VSRTNSHQRWRLSNSAERKGSIKGSANLRSTSATGRGATDHDALSSIFIPLSAIFALVQACGDHETPEV
jgi:hypothetical protein